MASTIIQFRVDEELKNEASKLYSDLGTDLSTAIRTFLKRSIKENGYPFDMKLQNNNNNNEAVKALRCIQAEARINGTYKMSLDEINDEIAEARKERRK